MSFFSDLARPPAQRGSRVRILRFLLPLAWSLTVAGYYGPWLAQVTAALTLSGADMAEFVKFLPQVQDGSLPILRQVFYLPPVAVVASIALLAWSRALGYARLWRWLLVAGAVPVSAQLLPPAWSPGSLLTPEFRLQAAALVACWLLLALSWLLGRLPVWMGGVLSAILSLAAIAVTSWQFDLTKPAIDAIYGRPPAVGWGFFLCTFGLVLLAVAGAGLTAWLERGGSKPWQSK